MDNLKNIPLNERMESQGLLVTNKKFGDWNNSNKMIINSEGVELGFMTPSQCLKLVKKLENETKPLPNKN